MRIAALKMTTRTPAMPSNPRRAHYVKNFIIAVVLAGVIAGAATDSLPAGFEPFTLAAPQTASAATPESPSALPEGFQLVQASAAGTAPQGSAPSAPTYSEG